MRTVALVTLGVGLGAVLRHLGGLRPRSFRRIPIRTDDLVLTGDLVVLGLLAGRSFLGALTAAGRHVAGPLADEIDGLVRRAAVQGSAAALATADGSLGPLVGVAARAVATGAPVAAAVAAFTADLRDGQRVAALAEARRLSVRLLFPLALLMLPGFVLLVAGPFVVEGLARFDL